MSRKKFWCQPCDYVCKARWFAVCPKCGEPMRDMGPKWRVGKKGKRQDWINPWRPWSPEYSRTELLRKLTHPPARPGKRR